MAYTIKNVEQIEAKARTHKVELYDTFALVTSSTSGNRYTVNLSSHRCTCERDKYISSRNNNVNACSHTVAALQAIAKEAGYTAKAHASNKDISHHKRAVNTSLNGDGVQLSYRKKAQPKPEVSVADINDDLFA